MSHHYQHPISYVSAHARRAAWRRPDVRPGKCLAAAEQGEWMRRRDDPNP